MKLNTDTYLVKMMARTMVLFCNNVMIFFNTHENNSYSSTSWKRVVYSVEQDKDKPLNFWGDLHY